jgi:hypothetical protein
MKIAHRVPTVAPTSNMTGRIEPGYQREVDNSMARFAADYLRAQKSLEGAERRLKKAQSIAVEGLVKKAKAKADKDTQALWVLVEARREELNILARHMSSTPAGSKNRGTDSFRPVPIRHGGQL